jgi:hypothetical protein
VKVDTALYRLGIDSPGRLRRNLLFVAAARRTVVQVVSTCVAALGVACSQSNRPAADTTSGNRVTTDVVSEARAFMDTYARDLVAGDRAAIAARYDRTGAYFLGNGRKELTSYDSIAADYRGGWKPPASFTWRDLSFEPAGSDAVVVAGQFAWGPAPGAPPLTFSYTALLRRQEGVLRIRLEDESLDPSTLPPPPAKK